MTVSVLVVDDDELIRAGLRAVLDAEPDLTVVGEAADAPTALALAGRLAPDVVLLDLALPGMGGIEAAAALRRDAPGSAVVVFTLYDDDRNWAAARAAGAAACVGKQEPVEALLGAIRQAAGHRHPAHRP